MREILFRGKGFYSDEWVEGYLAIGTRETDNAKEYAIIPVDVIFWEYGVSDLIQVIPETICQYTGLTDKNGNKIWENDVVKYHFGNDVSPIRFGEYQSCFDSTKTAHIGFYVDWDDRATFLRKDLGYWVNMIDCNVIGNIFDNPELLERN